MGYFKFKAMWCVYGINADKGETQMGSRVISPIANVRTWVRVQSEAQLREGRERPLCRASL